jgi:hypothetical protein
MAPVKLDTDSVSAFEGEEFLSLASGHCRNVVDVEGAAVAEALTFCADHLVPVGRAGGSNFEIVENALFASTLIFLQGVPSRSLLPIGLIC